MKKSKKFINKLAFSLAAAVLCAVAAVALVFTPSAAAYADETYAVYLFTIVIIPEVIAIIGLLLRLRPSTLCITRCDIITTVTSCRADLQ